MFKTFPEFSTLTLADKAAYESLIKDYPPVADISFQLLMTWWAAFGDVSVSIVDSNLVISYWMPGDEKNSGLSFIGVENVDESMCAIFDYLKDKGEKPKLVNVPEFVMPHIKYPDMFTVKAQHCYDEYLLSSNNYYPLENMSPIWRHRTKSKLSKLNNRKIEVKALDLREARNKYQLSSALVDWQSKNINDLGKHEQDACQAAIYHASTLEVENICIFVDGHLCGFCLYKRVSTTRIDIVHVKATSKHTVGYALMLYMFSEWLVSEGVEVINILSDVGIMPLRMFMLTLGPVNFYRKYVIRPA